MADRNRFTFTYSKRNEDVRKLIEDKKKYDDKFVVTDYYCEAARFYEAHRNEGSNINKETIKSIIIETLTEMKVSTINLDMVRGMVAEALLQMNLSSLSQVSATQEPATQEPVQVREIDTSRGLEIDNISDADLEED